MTSFRLAPMSSMIRSLTWILLPIPLGGPEIQGFSQKMLTQAPKRHFLPN
jgi:hypothetical protein